MALARALDERAWVLNRAGRTHFVISGQGHEGAEAGVTAALEPDRDWLLPYYRSLAGVLAFGMTPREVFLHQLGKADDPSSGGRQMPSHFGHAARRIFTSSSPVATQVLHAAGIALAAKLRGERQVALAAMGEGSSNQGDVHEALNFAGIHRLPLILLVENNGYAISVPAELQTAVRDVAARAAGYGMPGVVVDGADVVGCYLAAREAVERALTGGGPTFIEAKVTRLTGHSSDDQQTKYRSADELTAQRARDPLPRFRDELRAAGVLDDAAEAAIAAEVAAAVDDATEFAEAAADPDPATLGLHVYAEPGDPVPGPPPEAVGPPPGVPAGHAPPGVPAGHAPPGVPAGLAPPGVPAGLAPGATPGPSVRVAGPHGDPGRKESTQSVDGRTPDARNRPTGGSGGPTGALDANATAPPPGPPAVPGPP